MYKYLEIVVTKNDKVAKRFDITSKPKESIQKIYDKKSQKLPKTKFIRIITSEEELEAKSIK